MRLKKKNKTFSQAYHIREDHLHRISYANGIKEANDILQGFEEALPQEIHIKQWACAENPGPGHHQRGRS